MADSGISPQRTQYLSELNKSGQTGTAFQNLTDQELNSLTMNWVDLADSINKRIIDVYNMPAGAEKNALARKLFNDYGGGSVDVNSMTPTNLNQQLLNMSSKDTGNIAKNIGYAGAVFGGNPAYAFVNKDSARQQLAGAINAMAEKLNKFQSVMGGTLPPGTNGEIYSEVLAKTPDDYLSAQMKDIKFADVRKLEEQAAAQKKTTVPAPVTPKVSATPTSTPTAYQQISNINDMATKKTYNAEMAAKQKATSAANKALEDATYAAKSTTPAKTTSAAVPKTTATKTVVETPVATPKTTVTATNPLAGQSASALLERIKSGELVPGTDPKKNADWIALYDKTTGKATEAQKAAYQAWEKLNTAPAVPASPAATPAPTAPTANQKPYDAELAAKVKANAAKNNAAAAAATVYPTPTGGGGGTSLGDAFNIQGSSEPGGVNAEAENLPGIEAPEYTHSAGNPFEKGTEQAAAWEEMKGILDPIHKQGDISTEEYRKQLEDMTKIIDQTYQTKQGILTEKQKMAQKSLETGIQNVRSGQRMAELSTEEARRRAMRYLKGALTQKGALGTTGAGEFDVAALSTKFNLENKESIEKANTDIRTLQDKHDNLVQEILGNKLINEDERLKLLTELEQKTVTAVNDMMMKIAEQDATISSQAYTIGKQEQAKKETELAAKKKELRDYLLKKIESGEKVSDSLLDGVLGDDPYYRTLAEMTKETGREAISSAVTGVYEAMLGTDWATKMIPGTSETYKERATNEVVRLVGTGVKLEDALNRVRNAIQNSTEYDAMQRLKFVDLIKATSGSGTGGKGLESLKYLVTKDKNGNQVTLPIFEEGGKVMVQDPVSGDHRLPTEDELQGGQVMTGTYNDDSSLNLLNLPAAKKNTSESSEVYLQGSTPNLYQ